MILLKKAFTPIILATILFAQSALAQNKYTISGHITDEKSGETLIGAGVLNERNGEKTGSVTNTYGFYTLTLPAGQVNITSSYIGYEVQNFSFNLQKDTTINIQLRHDAVIDESIVVASKDAGIESTMLGSIEIPMTQIIKAPAVFGESDVLKTIQLMPGVQSGMEGTAGIYVRGGGPEENLMMLDGVPIYNVNHMLGIFSVFTPEAVKKVTFYKGSFPSRFGGRVSSIVDVRTNDGNLNEHHGTISVGLLNSKIHLEGPIAKGKTSYSFSARSLHTIFAEPIFALMKQNNNYYFYDINAKISHRFSDKDRVYLMLYNGLDKLKVQSHSYSENGEEDGEDNSHLNWGNTIVSGRWNHVFSPKLFANTTLAFNNYNMVINNESTETTINRLDTQRYKYTTETDSRYKSGIRDLSAKIDFDYTPSPKHLIKFGGEYVYHTFKPETNSTKLKTSENTKTLRDTTYKASYGGNMNGFEVSVYIDGDMAIGKHITFNPGVRYTLFNTSGKNYNSVQPRVSAKYSFLDGYALKASYARMAQYVHLLSSSQMALPTDLWVPITKNIKPVTSDQYSVGIYYTGLPEYEFSIEGYWKNTHNVLEYKDGMTTLASSMGWEEKVEMGEAESKGVEFFVQKTKGKATGWLSYTLAKSDRIFEGGSVNNGKKFPYKYDRRHNLSLCFNYEFSDRIDVSANWIFMSGARVTMPERQTVVVSPTGEVIIEDYIPYRNNYKIPASHRLNLGINFNKVKKHGVRTWNFSLYNAYCAMNPNYVFPDTDYDMTDDYIVKTKTRLDIFTLLPILPSFSYTYKF